jgi:hypothetical protein
MKLVLRENYEKGCGKKVYDIGKMIHLFMRSLIFQIKAKK